MDKSRKIMKEHAPFSTRIQPARKWSPEDERRLGQIMQKLADDLTEKAQLLRSLCSETGAKGGFNHPVLFCDENNCPYRKQFKKIISDTIEELEKSRKSFKSKQLEALRKRLCQELVRM
jgi:hypothetical protein